MRSRGPALLAIVVVAAVLVLALVLRPEDGPGNDTGNDTDQPLNDTPQNKSPDETLPGLQYHGYFQVFDLYMSSVFEEELRDLSAHDWTDNSAHIRNAALQSNLIVVPHVVESPGAYFYDPSYVETCVESGLKIVLLIHTLAKYAYFLDPRPCTDPERKELLTRELEICEEKYRKHRDEIVAIYLYDEPWVTPLNVTHQMLLEMAEVARSVLWNKPVIVMFHRQGNRVSYIHRNGTLIDYDRWAGSMPGAFDIIGVDPYYYAYHDDQPPEFRHTGDKGMVESDLRWASSFGKPIMLVGQAYDPGSGPFFDRDNTDPRLSIHEGFEDWTDVIPGEDWALEGDVATSPSTSYHGMKSLVFGSGSNTSSAVFKFEEVHSVRASLSFAVDLEGSPAFWITLGNEKEEPVRLGIQGRELMLHDGARVEVVNKSIDVSPGVWHSITIDADVDADRWTVWFDGDPQRRMPNAVRPSSFSQMRILKFDTSTRIWVDEVSIERDWSLIPLNEDETMLYYEVAKEYPQVNMLLWWSYPHSFASHLLRERDELQAADVWIVQRRIWEVID